MIFEGNYNLSKIGHRVHGNGRYSPYSLTAEEYRSMNCFTGEERL